MIRRYILWLSVVIPVFTWGCSSAPKTIAIKDIKGDFTEGTILSRKTAGPITFETMIAELENTQIVFVGEQHINPEHHKIQLQIIKAIYDDNLELKIGMEAFDFTYQPVLDEWSAGELDEKTFLKRVHWYTNWRYNFKLYRDVLEFIKEHRIPLIGLNIPFHIPPKIAIGGIDSLSDVEKQYLPGDIDTSDIDHRAYLKEIYKQHHALGRDDFESFYMAQCAWDEGMAESIARGIGKSKMVVLTGNGHIYRKFGIPARTYRRTSLPYRTIYLAPAGTDISLSDGDYIWATAAAKRK